jgi:hypothetical protein
MNERPNRHLGRRDVFRFLTLGAGAAVAAATPLMPAQAAEQSRTLDNGRARYQPNSPDIQNFYRVNRYPTK